MLKQLFQIKREYEENKKEAIENTINVFESKTGYIFTILFSTSLLIYWIIIAITPVGFEELYDEAEFYPFIIFFILSYFTLFLGSKFVFRPTSEELFDDTSIFAMFSACAGKSNRSFISAGLSILHTFIFILFLLNKDLDFF